MRQLEAMIRLGEARARVDLEPIISVKHVMEVSLALAIRESATLTLTLTLTLTPKPTLRCLQEGSLYEPLPRSSFVATLDATEALLGRHGGMHMPPIRGCNPM